MDKKYIIGVVVIVAIVGFVSWQTGYQSGWTKAKNVAQKSGILPPSGSIQIPIISGEVEAINGQVIAMKTSLSDPFSSEDLSKRTVETDQNTIFERLSAKDPTEFQKELAVFNTKMKDERTGGKNIAQPVFPVPFNFEKITLADIKKGDRITVTAAGNISSTKVIKATKVSVSTALTTKTIVPPNSTGGKVPFSSQGPVPQN